MRKALLLITMFILAMSFVDASIVFQHECDDRNCMGGTGMNFTVTVLNNIDKRLVLENVRIIDADYDTAIVEDGTLVNLFSGQSRQYIFKTEVPEPVKGYTIYYTACFDAKFYNGTEELGRETVCSDATKSFTTIPASRIECKVHDECNSNEYCNTNSLYKCKALECGDNEIAFNHECVTAECSVIEKVEDNSCVIDYRKSSLIGIILLVIVVGIALFPKKKAKKKKS